MFSKLRLKTNLLVAFLCVGIIPFAVMVVVSLLKAQSALNDQVFAQMESMRDVKKREVERYLQTIKDQVLTFSEDKMIVTAMIFNAIMTERSGMGETGETYLIGSDKLMRSDSYLDPDNHSVAASFRHPEKGKVDTEASRAAIDGKIEEKIIIDYNGNPVFSAYTPLSFEGMEWALLAEIDKAEAFAAVGTLRWVALIVAVIGIVCILGIALLVTRSIVHSELDRQHRRNN